MIWMNYDPDVQREIRVSVRANGLKANLGSKEEMHKGEILYFSPISHNSNTIYLNYVHGGR